MLLNIQWQKVQVAPSELMRLIGYSLYTCSFSEVRVGSMLKNSEIMKIDIRL